MIWAGGQVGKIKERRTAQNREKENHGEIDNRHSQSDFENGGDDEYRENWGGKASDVRRAGESTDSPSGLEWKEIENYGTDSEAGGLSYKSRRNMWLRGKQGRGQNRRLQSSGQ